MTLHVGAEIVIDNGTLGYDITTTICSLSTDTAAESVDISVWPYDENRNKLPRPTRVPVTVPGNGACVTVRTHFPPGRKPLYSYTDAYRGEVRDVLSYLRLYPVFPADTVVGGYWPEPPPKKKKAAPSGTETRYVVPGGGGGSAYFGGAFGGLAADEVRSVDELVDWVASRNGVLFDSCITHLVPVNLSAGAWDGNMRLVPLILPYWHRLLMVRIAGWTPQFTVDVYPRPSHGLNVNIVHPGGGSPFLVDPWNRSNPGALVITAPPDIDLPPDQCIHIVQRMVGAPDLPFFRYFAPGDSDRLAPFRTWHGQEWSRSVAASGRHTKR